MKLPVHIIYNFYQALACSEPWRRAKSFCTFYLIRSAPGRDAAGPLLCRGEG